MCRVHQTILPRRFGETRGHGLAYGSHPKEPYGIEISWMVLEVRVSRTIGHLRLQLSAPDQSNEELLKALHRQTSLLQPPMRVVRPAQAVGVAELVRRCLQFRVIDRLRMLLDRLGDQGLVHYLSHEIRVLVKRQL